MCSGSLHASNTCVNHGLTFPTSIEFSAANNGKSSAFIVDSQMLDRGLGNVGSTVAKPSKEAVGGINDKNSESSEKTHRKQIYKNLDVKRRLRLGKKQSCICGLYALDKAHINYNSKTKSASYSGIKHCNSVWECPLCRERIMQERSEELRKLSDYYGDYAALLATFTTPHYRPDSLVDLLGNSKDKTGIKGAGRRMMQHRQWREFCAKYKVIGHVRSIEVNHGKNGFHPHYHFAIFFGQMKNGKIEPYQFFGKPPKCIDKSLSFMENVNVENERKSEEIRKILYKLWKTVCHDAGLREPSEAHGVKVTNTVVDYIAKWGVSSELSGSAKKSAKTSDSKSIVQLETRLSELYSKTELYGKAKKEMPLVGLNDDELHEFKKIQSILMEYYEGMKGTRLLEWSRNFKKQIDEEMALNASAIDENTDEGKQVLVSLPAKLYHKIYKQVYVSRGIKYRASYEELLFEAERNPDYGVQEYIKRIGLDPSEVIPQYKKHSDIDDMNAFILGAALQKQREGYRNYRRKGSICV